MNVEQHLAYGSAQKSTECCESGTVRGPGDSARNKTYLCLQGMRNLGGYTEKETSNNNNIL